MNSSIAFHDDLPTKGDRAAREAADVPEHRLGGHRVLDAAVLQPVGPSGQEVPLRIEDSLTCGHSADPWVGERLDELAQRVAGPHGVGVDQHEDLAARELRAHLDRVALARDRCPRPHQAVVGELGTDLFERLVTRPVDHHDRLGRTLRDDAPEHVAEELHRFVDDRDEDARRRHVRLAPRLVAPGQHDLDHP
jgi:hypothetical protein